jgi:hypothetical protein
MMTRDNRRPGADMDAQAAPGLSLACRYQPNQCDRCRHVTCRLHFQLLSSLEEVRFSLRNLRRAAGGLYFGFAKKF